MRLPPFLRHRIPVSLSVPIVVVLFMIVVSIGASQVVLSRLASTQERQLRDLASVYLDGLEAALIDPVLRGDSWEVFDTLDRARNVYAAIKPIETTVTDADGFVLASSEPRRAPIGTRLAPTDVGAPDDSGVVLAEPWHSAILERALAVEGRIIGRIHSWLDISPLLAERAEVLWFLILSNAIVTLSLAALAWITVRRMVRPINVLLGHVGRAAEGSVEPIPVAQIAGQGPEWARLFRQFNRMADAQTERETLLTRVADEERLASLGRLASSVAHEINNPLGGILNAVDTIKVHGDDPRVRSNAIELIDRGLRGMRDVVRSILASYKGDRDSRDLTPTDIDDLLVLIRPEIRRKQLALTWSNGLPPRTPVNGYAIRQVVLNLLLNACKATPAGGALSLVAAATPRALEIEIADTGPGLPTEVAEFLSADGSSSRMVRSGLGLWVTKRIVREIGGAVTAGSSPRGGTIFRIVVPLEVAVLGEVQRVA